MLTRAVIFMDSVHMTVGIILFSILLYFFAGLAVICIQTFDRRWQRHEIIFLPYRDVSSQVCLIL